MKFTKKIKKSVTNKALAKIIIENNYEYGASLLLLLDLL